MGIGSQHEASATGRIVVLRGLPGVGKTTVSALLAVALEPAVRASTDTIRYLARPRDLSPSTIGLAERAAIELSLVYASAGYTALVDGVFADPEVIDALNERLTGEGIPVLWFSLVSSIDHALARNGSRAWFMQTAPDRIRTIAGSYTVHGSVVHTDDRVAEDVAEEIVERIAAESATAGSR